MTMTKIDYGKQLKEGDIQLTSQQKLWGAKPWKGMGPPPSVLFMGAGGVPEVTGIARPKANALGCPPEINDKMLFLTSLCSLDVGHREIKL